MPDIVNLTVEFRPFISPSMRQFNDEIHRLRETLSPELQPLLIGPIPLPINQPASYVIVHNGVGFERDGWSEWFKIAEGVIAAARRRYVSGRLFVSAWADVGEAKAHVYYVDDGRLYTDGDAPPESEIANVREELERLACETHNKLVIKD